MSRNTIEMMQEIAKKRGGRCLSKEYVNNHTHLEWQCECGNVWPAIPNNVIRGSWCPKCAAENLPRKPTIEDMQQLAKERGGKCLSKEYTNSGTKLTWQCHEEHTWEAAPRDVKQGTWCRRCVMNSKKLTIEDMQQLAEKRGGKCLSKKYINSRTKLKWQCSEDHPPWEATPKSIKKGTWCRRCAAKKNASVLKGTIEDMQQLAKEHGGRCLSKKYVDSVTCLEWECKCGITWEATPRSIKRGVWCPGCTLNKKSSPIKKKRNLPRKNKRSSSGERKKVLKELALKQMQQMAKEHDGKCLSTEYINSKTKLKWQCSEGHIWEAAPSIVRKGTWCHICKYDWVNHKYEGQGRPKLTLEIMQQVAEKCGGKCLSTEYIDSKTKLEWQCREGHIWKAEYHQIRKGSWCPECYHMRRGDHRKLDLDEMQRLAQMYGGECVSKEYTGIFNKLEWCCVCGYKWKARPSNVQRGSWCQKCTGNASKGQRITRAAFELIFGEDFPTVYPKWLRISRYSALELDGYCRKLRLAFEHQGGYHKGKDSRWGEAHTKDVQRRDRIKARRCKARGVTLIIVPEVPSELAVGKLVAYIISECQKAGIVVPKGYKSIRVKDILCRVYPLDELEPLRAFAKEHGGKLLSTFYGGAGMKYTWQCREGHTWEALFSRVKQGYWCPKCRRRKVAIEKLQKMQQIAKDLGGKCLSTRYVDVNTKLRWRCAKGHVWEATPQKIKSGKWCPTCARKRRK